jgi:hypothetical protein
MRVVARRLVQQALKGNMLGLKEIAERRNGKVAQTQVMVGNEDASMVRCYAEVPKPCSTTEEWLACNSVAPQGTLKPMTMGQDIDEASHVQLATGRPQLIIAMGVLFMGEKENLAVWAGVYMAGCPRDDHWLDLHPPTNRFLTERACYVFGHSCSPDSASTQHRLRAHGRKPVNVASLSTSCPHASNEASGIGVEFKGSRLGSPDFLPRSCRGKLQLPKQRCSTMWLRAPALALKAAGARKSMLVESHPPGPPS